VGLSSGIRGQLPRIVLCLALGMPAAFALSPPAPPPPTIDEVVQSAQTIFVGEVIATRWTPIRPDSTNAGSIAPEVAVTELLVGDARVTPHRITYAAGQQSMSQSQANAAYDGKSFVFAGSTQ